jgi:hypothetical protein
MRPYRQTQPERNVIEPTDHSLESELDAILSRIDELISPVSIDKARRDATHHLELFRHRFANALNDLELSPACGVIVAVQDGKIVIRTKSRRAAEILLRVLEHHADHHRWGSGRF